MPNVAPKGIHMLHLAANSDAQLKGASGVFGIAGLRPQLQLACNWDGYHVVWKEPNYAPSDGLLSNINYPEGSRPIVRDAHLLSWFN
jgi:hypothetical protein